MMAKLASRKFDCNYRVPSVMHNFAKLGQIIQQRNNFFLSMTDHRATIQFFPFNDKS